MVAKDKCQKEHLSFWFRAKQHILLDYYIPSPPEKCKLAQYLVVSSSMETDPQRANYNSQHLLSIHRKKLIKKKSKQRNTRNQTHFSLPPRAS